MVAVVRVMRRLASGAAAALAALALTQTVQAQPMSLCQTLSYPGGWFERLEGSKYRTRLEEYLYTSTGTSPDLPRKEAREKIRAAMIAAGANPLTQSQFFCPDRFGQFEPVMIYALNTGIPVETLMNWGLPVNLRNKDDGRTILDHVEARIQRQKEYLDEYGGPRKWNSHDYEDEMTILYITLRGNGGALHGWEIETGLREPK
mgnify:CR=1 FL=1